MSRNSKICPGCGRRMRRQFIWLQHCRRDVSWQKGAGFFERTPDMAFCLEWVSAGEKDKTRQRPTIRFR